MANDCATLLGLTSNNPGTVNDIENDLTAAQAAATAALDIAEIGYAVLLPEEAAAFALLIGSTAIPLLPIISLGFAVYELLGLFGGRPKAQDTDNVIGAYNQSGYWPLHALASDLSIALKNGAPISDSRSHIQAEFSQWKQGTIESIQGYAGWTPGAQSPGYWQLQRMINASWALSGQGQPAVLNMVKMIDRFTEILACLKQQQQSIQPPPPPQTPPPTGQPPPGPVEYRCEGTDPGADEILDSCRATQQNLRAILAAIQALEQPGTGGEIDPCCTAVVAAIGNVVSQLANITALLAAPAAPGQPIDLSGIVAALGELAAAVGAFPPLLEAITAALGTGLGNIATAIQTATGTDVSGIVAQLTRRNDDLQVDEAWKTAFINSGAIPPELVPLIQGTTTDDISAAMSGFAGYAIGAGISDPDSAGGRVWNKIVVPFGRAMWKVIQSLAAAVGIGDPALARQLGTAATAMAKLVDNAVTTVFGGVATLVLQGYESGIAGIDTTTDAGVNQVVQKFLGRAFELGIGAHMIALLPELAYFTKTLGLNASAALLAELAGFHEVMLQVHRPFMTAALGRPATYLNNRNYPTLLPAAPAGLALYARRKIPIEDANNLMASAGYATDWYPALVAGAYRPVQPRTLVQLFLDQPIDQTQLTAMLQDTAISDANVTLMTEAITYKSISNVRNAYLSSLITGYGKGVVGDDELQQALTDFNFSPQAQQYVKAHVLILRREVLATETEKQIVPEIVNGLITPAAAQQQLELAGVQPWYAELITGLAAVRAEIAVTKKELKAEEKLQAKQQLALQRAALADFANGSINGEALGAALIAAGLDPLVSAAVVAEKTATQIGRLKLVYGQLLTPAEAKLQTERVDAVKNQLKEQLITYQQALAQLKSFGVTDADANAIVAGVAAAIAAASTVGQLLNPLTGLPG